MKAFLILVLFPAVMLAESGTHAGQMRPMVSEALPALSSDEIDEWVEIDSEKFPHLYWVDEGGSSHVSSDIRSFSHPPRIRKVRDESVPAKYRDTGFIGLYYKNRSGKYIPLYRDKDDSISFGKKGNVVPSIQSEVKEFLAADQASPRGYVSKGYWKERVDSLIAVSKKQIEAVEYLDNATNWGERSLAAGGRRTMLYNTKVSLQKRLVDYRPEFGSKKFVEDAIAKIDQVIEGKFMSPSGEWHDE